MHTTHELQNHRFTPDLNARCLKSRGKKLVLGALTGDRMANDRLLRLHEYMQGQGLERQAYITPGEPTFSGPTGQSIVDLFYGSAEVALELPVCEVLDMVERFSNFLYKNAVCHFRPQARRDSDWIFREID